MASGVWEAQQLHGIREGRADRRRQAHGVERDGGHRHRHLHDHDADRRGAARAADSSGVTFKLGDSSLPKAPVEGGSFTASSVGSAVKAACDKVQRRAVRACARSLDGSPLAARAFRRCHASPTGTIASARAIRHARSPLVEHLPVGDASASIEEEATAVPRRETGAVRALSRIRRCSRRCTVDEDLGHDPRHASRQRGRRGPHPEPEDGAQPGAGRRSSGASAWRSKKRASSITRFGRIMNHNLAEYHVPVNADVHDIEVIFVEERDEIVNPSASKGIGEIGIVGVAAAIANAVFHATGTRVRRLADHAGQAVVEDRTRKPRVFRESHVDDLARDP